MAFLNGGIEEVHVEQAQGYMVKGKEENAYQLKKALYGLKQAQRAWNGKIDKYFFQDKMKRSPSEPPLYVKEGGKLDFLIVCSFFSFFLFDDLIYTCPSEI